ncbi:MAG: ComEC/Rec2 family competence protein [Candidatus Yanofskybacteria bacterium]|nr:ComEC/Rec2 family competence protein [Candidatus Yanofskybacteria bacterium]
MQNAKTGNSTTWHKSEILSLLLAAFIAGVFIGSFSAISQEFILAIVLIGLGCLAISGYQGTFGHDSKGIRKRIIGILIGCCVIVGAVGLYWVNSFRFENSILLEFDRWLADDKGVPVLMRGYVDGEFVATERAGQFEFRVKELIVGGKSIDTNEKTLVQAGRFPEYDFGQTLSLAGTPQAPKNFSDFDYVAYLRKDGIRTVVRMPEIQTISEIPMGNSERLRISMYSSILEIKDKFESSLQHSITEPGAALTAGLLLGSRTDIPQDLKDDFATTGMSHILAISGYNIAIVAELMMIILLFFMRRKTAFLMAVVAICGFVILTGATSSVVRAAFMGILLLFASGFGRLYDPRASILLAAAAMIAINPLILRHDLGFQLSFAAVLGLFYLSPLLLRMLLKFKLPQGFKKMLAATLGAQIAVLPLILYHFHSFALYAVPANVVILPTVPITMLLGFITGLGGLIFEQLGRLVGVLTWVLTEFQIMAVRQFAHLPFSNFSVNIPLSAVPVMYAAIISTVFLLRKRDIKS